MVDKDGNKVDIMEDLIRLEQELMAYLKEIESICEDVRTLEGFHQQCFEELSSELPKAVLDLRKMRGQKPQCKANLKRPAQFLQKAEKKKGAEDMASDIFSSISVNCKYKKRIKNMLLQVDELNASRMALEEKYSDMRKEVFKIKQIKLYKPVKGDAVDEMFAGYLNKAKLEIEVQRISASNYMFGTKKILAKIINDRLVIRVGGGYMNAEEFIEQYGKIEMMKMLKLEESKNEVGFTEGGRRESVMHNPLNMSRNSLRPGTGLALNSMMKEQMRQTLMTVTNQKEKGHDDTNYNSLKVSAKQNKTMITRQSVNPNTGDLKQALEGLKQGYKKTLEETPTQKVGGGRRMTVLNPGLNFGALTRAHTSQATHSPEQRA